MSKGTDGDDIITLSSGNDEFLVTTGDDFIDGGEGIDTLVIPFDAAAVIRSIKSIEYSTNTELEFGQKYIAIKVLEDGNDWTTAINFEFIRYSNQNNSVSLQKFDGNSSWSLPDKETLTVPNKKGIFQHLNLYDNGYHTINETASHTYKIKSISDSDFEDQIVIGKWSESSRVIETLEPNSNGRYLKWKSGTGDNGKDITVVFEVTYKSTSLYDKFGPFTKEYEIIIPDMVDIVVDQYKLSFVLDPNYPVLTSHNDQDSIQGGTLNFTSKDDLIILTGGGTYRGLGGDDLFFVSNLMATNSNFTMVDTSGSNIIQMPKNTKITKAQFASDSVRLTLDEGRVITINGADNHTFNLGGNVTSGDQGNDFSYSEFAALFGIGLSDLSGVETSNEGYYI